MIVVAWNDGGGGYGVRITHADRDQYFLLEWEHVRVKIADGDRFACRLTSSFWNKCSEIRGTAFRDWFRRLGYIRGGRKAWEKGSPPKFDMTPTSGNCFVLKTR